MVFHAETNFSPGRRWFWAETPTFSCQKHGFGLKNQFFPTKKMVLDRKNPLFSRKKMVLDRKTNFSQGRQKIHFFGVWPYSLPKDIICGFPQEKVGLPVQNHLLPRKKLVLRPKSIFFLGKLGASLQNPFFGSEECAFHLLFVCVAKQCCQ